MTVPFYVSVPLGPVHWSHRIGRARRCHAAYFRRSRFQTWWYWLLGAWAIEAAFWLAVAMVLLYVVLGFALVAGGRWLYRQKKAARGASQ